MSDGNLIPTPDQRLRVFVSSTLTEMASERAAVHRAVEELRLTPVMFELGSRPHPPRQLYRAYLAQSQVFVGLYWQSYGWVAPGETTSGLEEEYQLAEALPKLIYVKSPAPGRDPRLAELLALIRDDDRVSYKPFSTAVELRRLVKDDLAVLLTERFETARDRERPPAAAGPVSGLPVPPTPLLGRERELEALGGLLLTDGVREVTLTGPGGVGKSRLALAAALQLRPRFPDGVVFVELAPLATPDLVASALAGALGVRRAGTQPPIDAVKSYLVDKRLLLCVDNFEQVTEAAPLIAEVLAAAPGVKVLTTSRAVLRLSGEHDFAVPPLSLPPTGAGQDVQELGRYEAVRLFVQRAQAANPGFQLSSDNAEAVAEICRRLDGLPLALELAAARARLLPAQALLAHLDDRLGLLSREVQDLPERQRTLRNTLAWSYDLLTPDEQKLFARLGVFAGGFDLPAVEAIAGPGSDSPSDSPSDWAAEADQPPHASGQPADVLDALGALVDNSLVQPEEHHGEPRFTMLDTIRDYALERLRDTADWQQAHDRHAAYYLAFAEAAERGLEGPEQPTWLARLEAEYGNLRAALFQFIEQDRIELLVRLAKSVWMWALLHGREEDGLRWIRKVLSHSGLPPSARALALAKAGAMDFGRGDLAAAQAHLDESRSLYHQVGDPPDPGLITAIAILGQLATTRGDSRRAMELLEEGLARSRDSGEVWHTAVQLNSLGQIPLHEGDYSQAIARFTEALGLSRRVRDSLLIAVSLYNLAYARLARGELTEATGLLEEGLWSAAEVGDDGAIAHYLEGLAALAQRQDDPERAGRLYGAAEALPKPAGSGWTPTMLGAAAPEPSPQPPTGTTTATFERARKEGAAMGRRRAVQYALHKDPAFPDNPD